MAGGLLRSSLYGLSTFDPIAFAGVGMVLAVASIVATVVPARHAARVDPVHALRHE